MEKAKGEMSFPLFRLMYMKCTSDTSSALPAGVPAGRHWLSMYSASFQATQDELATCHLSEMPNVSGRGSTTTFSIAKENQILWASN